MSATPGNPIRMGVVFINNAADSLALTSNVIDKHGGTYETAPADSVARYGAPGQYNYGYKMKGDWKTGALR